MSLLSLSIMAAANLPSLSADRVLDYRGATRAAEVITADSLRASLQFIASDALQGRDTPSAGLDAAAEFLAYNLHRWGAKPGGDDGTYFQKVELVKKSFDPDKTVLRAGDLDLRLGKDLLVYNASGSFKAPVIYIDKELEGKDVKGKILLTAEGVRVRETKLRELGALGVIRDSGLSGESWDSFAKGSLSGGRFTPKETDASESWIRASLNQDQFKALVTKLGLSAAKDSDPAATLDVRIGLQSEPAMTQNVVAIVEGSDPKLKSEYVAFGAHYDHLGVGRGKTGHQIYNGADDDGSGTVSILAIAEAALRAKDRPKRSLIFVWHCGEEKGLWGSQYFNEHPTVSKGSIVTQLNIDMIGRTRKAGDTKPANKTLVGDNTIYVIGTTMMSTRLGEIVHQVNNSYLRLIYDNRYDDPKDPNRFFYRSDHYNYAKVGIPIAFWFDGVHEDYHQKTDTVEKIDFAKMEKIVRTIFLTGVTVANEPARPPVDKPLDR